MKPIYIFTLIHLFLFLFANAKEQIVKNKGFESGKIHDESPLFWKIGFSGVSSSLAKSRGKWFFDSSYYTEGKRSLKIKPDNDSEAYNITQILHVPTYNLKGKKVVLKADVRHLGLSTPPVILLLAVNPGLKPDTNPGTGIAGKIARQVSSSEDQFITIKDSMIPSAKAEYMVLGLSAKGKQGTAWFDNISVKMNVSSSGNPPLPMESPLQSPRNFKMGISTQNFADRSKCARIKGFNKIKKNADAANIFTHIRWNEITGKPLTYMHDKAIEYSKMADEHNLEKILTFDFTHGAPENVGKLNPIPGEKKVGNLKNDTIRNALKNELFALVDTIKPSIVSIGIEMNLFYEKNPDQWNNFVSLFKNIAHDLNQKKSSIHATTYFTLRWMINKQGNINESHANIWRQLLPEIESICYSVYPGNKFYPHPDSLSDDYYKTVNQIAPELPLAVNEFGVHGGDSTLISEKKQAKTLSSILSQLSSNETHYVSWYSLYDQQHLGTPAWFKEAFSSIGLYYKNRTPKKVKALWKAVFEDTVSKNTSTIPINKKHSKNSLLTIYPNPVNKEQEFLLKFNIDKQDVVKIRLLNINGKILKQLKKDKLKKGIHKIKINPLRLKPGIYFVRLVSSKNADSVAKVILK